MKDSKNHYAKIKKPDIKHHKLYDSIYIKCPTQAILETESGLFVD